jgi:tetratricopeptide (TPR) repeat protein
MTASIYIVKALDSYPYAIEECVESLNYAMSYEPDNVIALYLMAKVHAEFFKDYEQAKSYFQQAFSANNSYCELYPDYIECLYNHEEYDAALRLVEFALKVKGINKGAIYYKKAIIYDRMQKFKKALQTLDEAVIYAHSNEFIQDLEDFQKLIERKQKNKRIR